MTPVRRRRRGLIGGGRSGQTVQIALSPSTLSLSAGTPTATLTAVAKDFDGNPTGAAVYLYSSDPTVATVDPITKVAAFVGAGSDVIYATLIPPPVADLPTFVNDFQFMTIPQVAMSNPRNGSGAPYTYSSSDLPTGIVLSSDGIFTGTPTVSGTFTFHVAVTDKNGITGTVTGSITISNSLDVTVPDTTGKTLVVDDDLSAYTSFSDMVANYPNNLWATSGAPNNTQDYGNDWAHSKGGSTLEIGAGPGGKNAASVNYRRVDMRLVGAIDAVTDTVIVDDNTGLGDLSLAGAHQIQIDSEKMTITDLQAGNVIKVTRGVAGSTAATHANNAKVTDLTSSSQESHQWARSLNGDALIGKPGHAAYFAFDLKMDTIDPDGKGIDWDLARRFGIKFFEMWYATPFSDRAQFSTGATGDARSVPPSSVSPMIDAGGAGGTTFHGWPNGGSNTPTHSSQARGPWIASYEGLWVPCFMKFVTHSAPGRVLVNGLAATPNGFATQFKTSGLALAGSHSITIVPTTGGDTITGTIINGDTFTLDGELGSNGGNLFGPTHTVSGGSVAFSGNSATVTFTEALASDIPAGTNVNSPTFAQGPQDGQMMMWLDSQLIVAITKQHLNQVVSSGTNSGTYYAPAKWTQVFDLDSIRTLARLGFVAWGSARGGGGASRLNQMFANFKAWRD